MFVHKICNKIPQLNFQRRLVLQQPVDFPVDTVYPYRYLLQRAADIAQAQQMLRAARCCRSACVSADSAGAHPAAAARARRPARQIAVSPPASPAACWWQNHRPARSPTARPENCRAPRRRQRTRNYPAAGHNTRCPDSGGYNRWPPADHTPFHRGDVDLVFTAHKPIRRQRLSGRDLAGEDLRAQLRIDLLIQALCAVADYAHAQNPDCLVIVDNTFSTPLLVQPLKLGADVVVHGRDQVSQRPRRRGRGLLGGAQGDHGPDPHGQTQGHYGRSARAAGGVFDPARPQDAQGAHGRRLRKHAESGGLPCRLQVCAESVLSQSGEPSRSRRGRPRDDAVRRRCLVRDGQLRGSQEGAQPRASVRAGRQPRRLRDAHPASGFHDALRVHERRDRGRRLLGSPDPSGGRSGRHRYIIADLQQAFEAAQN